MFWQMRQDKEKTFSRKDNGSRCYKCYNYFMDLVWYDEPNYWGHNKSKWHTQ